MPTIRVSQCICRRVKFEQLLPLARQRGWALDVLMRETGCGDQCGLCLPYLRRMLATGETAFNELLTE
jgi:bacterioferritin-associated ferredoxin